MCRPPRLPAFNYTGLYRYFLTFCARDRRKAFVTNASVSSAVAQFRRTATQESFAILAYCFMPDHAHMLVEGVTESANLRRFVKLSKQRSGAAYAMVHGTALWQEGYYERVLRRHEDTLAVVRYILANPVRAGLVANPHDYPYSGSDEWTMTEILESVG